MRRMSNKRELIILAVGLLILLVSVVGVFAERGNLNQANEALKQEEEKFELSKSRLSSLKELKEKEEELERQMQFFINAFPQEPAKGQVIDIIKSSAAGKGEIKDIRIEELIVDDDGYGRIPLSISYEGRYRGLVKFVHNLQTAIRVFELDSIDINEGEGGYPQITAEISAGSFYSKEVLTQ